MRSYVLLALLSLAAFTLAMDHDQLVQFMIGYMEELKFTEDLNKYLKCIDDSSATRFDNAFKAIEKIDWQDNARVIYAFSVMVQPAIIAIGELTACGEEEIHKLYLNIMKTLNNAEEFAKKVREEIDRIGQALQELLEKVKGTKYMEAGKVTGALLHSIFLN